MADYIHGPLLVVDLSGKPQAGAAGKVYAPDDETFATPLVMTDLSGVTQEFATANAYGYVSELKVADHPEVVWKSGDYIKAIRSFGSVLDRAILAEQNSQITAQQSVSAASAAANSASVAQQALTDLQGYIDANPGGGGGVGYVLLNPTDPDPDPFDPTKLYIRLTAPGGDIDAPTVPTGFVQSNITTSTWTLDWANSTDTGGGPVTYEVQINGGVAIPAATSVYAATGQSSGVTYTVRVRSLDASLNRSAWSTPQSITTTAGGGSAQHSIFGASDSGGTWTLATDGTPTIELGHGFYRYGSGTGWYSGMRILGARIWKPSAITLPTQVTVKLYTGTPTSVSIPANLGTEVRSKVATPTWATGWNTVLFDTPIAMPANGELALLTYQFTSSGDAGKYLSGPGGLRSSTSSFQALDGTKLVWSDREPSTGYYDNLFVIGVTPGRGGAADVNYGIDILVDEG